MASINDTKDNKDPCVRGPTLWSSREPTIPSPTLFELAVKCRKSVKNMSFHWANRYHYRMIYKYREIKSSCGQTDTIEWYINIEKSKALRTVEHNKSESNYSFSFSMFLHTKIIVHDSCWEYALWVSQLSTWSVTTAALSSMSVLCPRPFIHSLLIGWFVRSLCSLLEWWLWWSPQRWFWLFKMSMQEGCKSHDH